MYTMSTVPTIGIGFLFIALQPVWSTLLAMTKSDVRKYTFDLLSLSYCRRHNCCRKKEILDDNDTDRQDVSQQTTD